VIPFDEVCRTICSLTAFAFKNDHFGVMLLKSISEKFLMIIFAAQLLLDIISGILL